MNKQEKINKANELLHTLVELDYSEKMEKYQTKINRAAKIVSTLLHENDILRWKIGVYHEKHNESNKRIKGLFNEKRNLENIVALYDMNGAIENIEKIKSQSCIIRKLKKDNEDLMWGLLKEQFRRR